MVSVAHVTSQAGIHIDGRTRVRTRLLRTMSVLVSRCQDLVIGIPWYFTNDIPDRPTSLHVVELRLRISQKL